MSCKIIIDSTFVKHEQNTAQVREAESIWHSSLGALLLFSFPLSWKSLKAASLCFNSQHVHFTPNKLFPRDLIQPKCVSRLFVITLITETMKPSQSMGGCICSSWQTAEIATSFKALEAHVHVSEHRVKVRVELGAFDKNIWKLTSSFNTKTPTWRSITSDEAESPLSPGLPISRDIWMIKTVWLKSVTYWSAAQLSTLSSGWPAPVRLGEWRTAGRSVQNVTSRLWTRSLSECSLVFNFMLIVLDIIKTTQQKRHLNVAILSEAPRENPWSEPCDTSSHNPPIIPPLSSSGSLVYNFMRILPDTQSVL